MRRLRIPTGSFGRGSGIRVLEKLFSGITGLGSLVERERDGGKDRTNEPNSSNPRLQQQTRFERNSVQSY